MALTFLHLSDFHHKAGQNDQHGLILTSLLADLRTSLPRPEDALLVFSGDFVQQGDDKSYADFLKTIEPSLTQAGFPRHNRVAIPGNHDIDRSALSPLMPAHFPTVSSFTEERQFNDALPAIEASLFLPGLTAYKSFEGKFAGFSAVQTTLGGCGWDLAGGVGLYCLNTSLCSSGGLPDPSGNPISDKARLHVDTRHLHTWLRTTSSSVRILVMHHPLDWLSPWAQLELGQTISRSFRLVLSGHNHTSDALQHTRHTSSTVFCSAPALFSSKTEPLGYSLISIDPDNSHVRIRYRAWSSHGNFVAGTHLSGTDDGTLTLGMTSPSAVSLSAPSKPVESTLHLLEAEFDEAITCYSSKRILWVERDLCAKPETAHPRGQHLFESAAAFAHSPRSCIIRAPSEFGLSSLASFVALEAFRFTEGKHRCCVIDAKSTPNFKQGLSQYIVARMTALAMTPGDPQSIIVDNWTLDKNGRRIVRDLRALFPKTALIFMCGVDDCADIANQLESDTTELPETIYLWALSRSRVRELVTQYIALLPSLDDDAVTKKVLADLEALNIHRTPSNCLMILKLLEQAFDDSPVNRTEMIGRVLYLLFYQFDKIPRYATRPDLKDCEYALGYLCEWLLRNARFAFTKSEFAKKVREYCDKQILDLDTELLFAFLLSEHILISKASAFEFRFKYWLYYFAAHRMLHDEQFADYILSERRYATMPEIIEFYTGIDRRRTNAVLRLTSDLSGMIQDFQNRTGISQTFNPYQHAKWLPDDRSLELVQQDVAANMAGSTMPKPQKDELADRQYDRSRPYNQQLATFVEHSTLAQMVAMMRGAARALRNSDHVSPDAKKELLRQVLDCWNRISQILTLLSYVLASKGNAVFEGMGFVLGDGFESMTDLPTKLNNILTVIPENVVGWYQEDMFSKKMGALLFDYIESNRDSLPELLAMLVVVQQRPPGWEGEVEKFIVNANKNSFAMSRVFDLLLHEYKTSICSEHARQGIRRLAAMSIAKHHTGSRRPDSKLIERAAKGIDPPAAEDSQARS